MIEASVSFWVFIGRFHHLANHFPIVLIILTFFIEFATRIGFFRKLKPAITPLLFLAAISGVFASLLGYVLYQAGDYQGDLVIPHMWLGIAVSTTALITYFVKVLKLPIKNKIKNNLYLTLLTITAGTVVIAGHQGGSLGHGKGYLTEYMPQVLRSIAGLPSRRPVVIKITDLQEAIVFNDIVAPIFESRCLTCHKQENNKSGLSLETPEGIQVGGENGPSLIPGNSEMSEIVKRIVLPLDDEHRMPKGKSPLSENQIQLISWWIDEGASFDAKVKRLNVPKNIRSILDGLTVSPVSENDLSIVNVQSLDTVLVQQLQDKGFHIWRISQDSDLLRIVYVQFGDSKFSDEELQQLLPLSSNISWLDIGESQITNDGMNHLSKFRNLERLHLDNTSITDEGIEKLVFLNNLTYLNLYGTDISDLSLESISQMKSLKSLYLWNTKVTKKGVAQLREQLPDLNIESGIVISAIKRDAAHTSKS